MNKDMMKMLMIKCPSPCPSPESIFPVSLVLGILAVVILLMLLLFSQQQRWEHTRMHTHTHSQTHTKTHTHACTHAHTHAHAGMLRCKRLSESNVLTHPLIRYKTIGTKTSP